MDSDLAHWFRNHLTPTFVDLLWALTTPGSALFITCTLVLCVAALAWKKHWFPLASLITTVGTGSLFGETLKLIVHRVRPFPAGPFGEWGGYSFPSGHTIAATLLYGFLALAMLRLFKRRRWRFLSTCSLLLLIVSVGFSRIALGAHYLTDVLGAMTLGTLWIFLCPACLRILHKKIRQPVSTSTPAQAQPEPAPQLALITE